MVADRPVAARTGTPCLVILPEHGSSRALDLLGRALSTGGPLLARAGRVHMRGGEAVDVPVAATYLVFGQAQAEALGRCLPAEVWRRAQVVVVDELASVLGEAGAKRRLWVALRGLRMMLAAERG